MLFYKVLGALVHIIMSSALLDTTTVDQVLIERNGMYLNTF